MAYGSVIIPAGCTVKIGDTVPGLENLGVLKGDAEINVTYDKVRVMGSKAERLLDGIKNPKATATFELYQIYWPNIEQLAGGAIVATPVAGVLVPGAVQVVASGAWSYNNFISIENQNGDGGIITVNSVTGSVDGLLVAETDYFIGQNELGTWGIFVIDSVTLSTEVQTITIDYDYTPNVSYSVVMGAPYTVITRKILEFSRLIDGLTGWVRLWSVANDEGLALRFPDVSQEEPVSLPMTLSGELDTTKASGEQLFEIHDPHGIVFP